MSDDLPDYVLGKPIIGGYFFDVRVSPDYLWDIEDHPHFRGGLSRGKPGCACTGEHWYGGGRCEDCGGFIHCGWIVPLNGEEDSLIEMCENCDAPDSLKLYAK